MGMGYLRSTRSCLVSVEHIHSHLPWSHLEWNWLQLVARISMLNDVMTDIGRKAARLPIVCFVRRITCPMSDSAYSQTLLLQSKSQTTMNSCRPCNARYAYCSKSSRDPGMYVFRMCFTLTRQPFGGGNYDKHREVPFEIIDGTITVVQSA